MADCSSKCKKLSLDQVTAGVLQNDEEQELSDFEKSESEIGDTLKMRKRISSCW